MTKEQARAEAEQILTVSDLKNICAVIAKAQIKENGFYACVIDGVKTFIEE